MRSLLARWRDSIEARGVARSSVATVVSLGALALAASPAAAPATRTVDPLPARVRHVALADAPRSARAESARRCPFGELSGVCLPRPRCLRGEFDLGGICARSESDDALGGPLEVDVANELATNAHVDRTGQLVVYEHVPRGPDRPAEYGRYVYPTEPYGGSTVSSGYDLGEPDARQRRGAELNAVGHGGVDLSQERGAPVRVVALRGQVGDAEVLYAGWVFGTTVVLRHTVREGRALRTYLTMHGHLDAIAPGIQRGRTVAAQDLLGAVGDSGASGMVHLHYEVRLVRPGVDPARVDIGRVTEQPVSVPCDPRNVLPLREARAIDDASPSPSPPDVG